MPVKMNKLPSRAEGTNVGKYHVSKSDEIAEIKAKYAAIKADTSRKYTIKDINPEDVDILLEKYATDLSYDVYTLQDALCINRSQLYRLLHSEACSEAYESARNQRANRSFKRGFDVLDEVHQLAKAGESNRDMVNSAKNIANYCLSYGQMISDEYNPNVKGNQGAANIVINLPMFNQRVVDCEVEDDSGQSN